MGLLREPDEGRAAAELLHRLTKAEREAETNEITVRGAAQRVLRTPLIGSVITRAARWIIRRTR